MPKPPFDEQDLSAGYRLLRAHDPLPPYELDPQFDDPVVRQRIGDLIARSMVLGELVTKGPNRGMSWAADRVKGNRSFPMR
jgi:hypothetical protein